MGITKISVLPQREHIFILKIPSKSVTKIQGCGRTKRRFRWGKTMIFCKSHSNCGQKIVFLDFQICFGQEDSPHGAFWYHVSLRKVFGHVSSMYRGSRLRSTLNTSYIRFGHVSSMYRGSRLRSTLNTDYITGLDMCQVCTEAVDCVAL